MNANNHLRLSAVLKIIKGLMKHGNGSTHASFALTRLTGSVTSINISWFIQALPIIVINAVIRQWEETTSRIINSFIPAWSLIVVLFAMQLILTKVISTSISNSNTLKHSQGGNILDPKTYTYTLFWSFYVLYILSKHQLYTVFGRFGRKFHTDSVEIEDQDKKLDQDLDLKNLLRES